MRTVSTIHWSVLVPLAFSTQLLAAEVFKCTTAEGKTSYSASPCAAEGAKEMVVPIVPPPPAAAGKSRDWAAENAAGNARAKAAASAAATANAPKASAPAKNAQQTVAECEANRGIDCSSAEEIAKRKSDERTLTEEEAAALHRAAAGRRENERKEALTKPPTKPGK